VISHCPASGLQEEPKVEKLDLSTHFKIAFSFRENLLITNLTRVICMSRNHFGVTVNYPRLLPIRKKRKIERTSFEPSS
jgi:hypothetical protein